MVAHIAGLPVEEAALGFAPVAVAGFGFVIVAARERAARWRGSVMSQGRSRRTRDGVEAYAAEPPVIRGRPSCPARGQFDGGSA